MLAGRRTQRLLSLRSATGTPTTRLPRRSPRGSTPLTAGCGLLTAKSLRRVSSDADEAVYFFPPFFYGEHLATGPASGLRSGRDIIGQARSHDAYGNVSAAVFRNPLKTKDGETVYSYTVSVRRSYQQNGKWAQTHSLRQGDLLGAAHALERCYDFISEAAVDGLEAESEQ